jgi:hypothetical protein
MQRRVSAFKNYTIEAPDGKVGHISDVLFEDNNWKIRWFVVNTGPWLLGRKLLIHPKALGRPDIRQRAFAVSLTKAEVETSPDISTDPPVFLQMEQVQPAYYAYTPNWNGGDYNGNGSAGARATSPYLDGWQSQGGEQPGDPHLRSLGEVVGYHIQALDGDIGHLEDFLVDDETWTIEYAWCRPPRSSRSIGPNGTSASN